MQKFDHELKSWPRFFQAIVDGEKKHDLRSKIDRDFKIGDILKLREYDPFGDGYSGREFYVEVTYITSNDTPCALSSMALDRDCVILSLRAARNTTVNVTVTGKTFEEMSPADRMEMADKMRIMPQHLRRGRGSTEYGL